MKTSLILFISISLAHLGFGAEIVPGQSVSLSENAQAIEGTREITISAGETLERNFFVIENPEVGKSGYLLKGEVRHENVGGAGMLEMWSVFSPAKEGEEEQTYFSRTAGDFGPMGKLKGTSAWKPFMLPFNPDGVEGELKRLEINVLLPDGGTVWLRNILLDQWDAGGSGNSQPAGAWGTIFIGLILGLIFATGGLVLRTMQFGKSKTPAKIGIILMFVIGFIAAVFAMNLGDDEGARTTRNFSWLISILLIFLGALYTYLLKKINPVEDELRRMTAADL